jgi:hypothetical protein
VFLVNIPQATATDPGKYTLYIRVLFQLLNFAQGKPDGSKALQVDLLLEITCITFGLAFGKATITFDSQFLILLPSLRSNYYQPSSTTSLRVINSSLLSLRHF